MAKAKPILTGTPTYLLTDDDNRKRIRHHRTAAATAARGRCRRSWPVLRGYQQDSVRLRIQGHCLRTLHRFERLRNRKAAGAVNMPRAFLNDGERAVPLGTERFEG